MKEHEGSGLGVYLTNLSCKASFVESFAIEHWLTLLAQAKRRNRPELHEVFFTAENAEN
jgi:hypothetical protein